MKLFTAQAFVAAAVLSLACSEGAPSTNPPPSPSGGAGGSGGSGSTMNGGSTTNAAGQNGTTTGGSASGAASTAGGSGSGGAAGTGGSGGEPAAAGSAGSSTAGASQGGTGGAPPGEPAMNFTCTQVIGAMITGEWFNGGNFEDKLEALGGDPDKWELKNEHYGTIEKWVDPSEGPAANDHLYWGHAVSSACAASSNNPDRVIFTAISWELTTEQQWTTALQTVVQNIKAKYSNIRSIELTSQIRCPNNMMCNPNAVQGPGSDAQASKQDCYVWPAQDAAMAAVAAADPIVSVTPPFAAKTCRPEGIDGAHLGGANDGAAQAVAEYYAEHP
jgi:hypothetical protein